MNGFLKQAMNIYFTRFLLFSSLKSDVLLLVIVILFMRYQPTSSPGTGRNRGSESVGMVPQ